MKHTLFLILAAVLFLGAGCMPQSAPEPNANTTPATPVNESPQDVSVSEEWKLYEDDSFSMDYPADWKVDTTTYADKVYFLPKDGDLGDDTSEDSVLFWITPGGHGGPAACFDVATPKVEVSHDGFTGYRKECPGAVTYLFDEKIDSSRQIEKDNAYFEVWFEFADKDNDTELIEYMLSTLSVK